ncbi:MAG: phospholipase D-like domain-containing protein [Candidatus Helarchaeota archaeon]
MCGEKEFTTCQQTDLIKKVEPELQIKNSTVLYTLVNSNPTNTIKLLKYTGLKDELSLLINEADSEIIISTFSLDANQEITRLLTQKAKSIKVRVLIWPRLTFNVEKSLELISNTGVQIRGLNYLHAKFLIIKNSDGSKKGLVMSANFTDLGLNSGFETGLKLTSSQLDELESIFEVWWNQADLEWLNKASISDTLGTFRERRKETDDKTPPLFISIRPEKKTNLQLIKLKTLRNYQDQIKSHLEQLVNSEQEKDYIYRAITIPYKIIYPQLPHDAIFEQSFEKRFDLYEKDKEKFVVITSLQELKTVEQIKNLKNRIIVFQQNSEKRKRPENTK